MGVKITTTNEVYAACRRDAWRRLLGAALCLAASAFTPHLLALGLYLGWCSLKSFALCRFIETKTTLTTET